MERVSNFLLKLRQCSSSCLKPWKALLNANSDPASLEFAPPTSPQLVLLDRTPCLSTELSSQSVLLPPSEWWWEVPEVFSLEAAQRGEVEEGHPCPQRFKGPPCRKWIKLDFWSSQGTVTRTYPYFQNCPSLGSQIFHLMPIALVYWGVSLGQLPVLCVQAHPFPSILFSLISHSHQELGNHPGPPSVSPVSYEDVPLSRLVFFFLSTSLCHCL